MAVIVWLPMLRDEVVNLAWPEPSSVPDPRVVIPSLKVTVPVGVPAAGASDVTVAVKVTDWPKTEVAGEALTVVALSCWPLNPPSGGGDNRSMVELCVKSRVLFGSTETKSPREPPLAIKVLTLALLRLTSQTSPKLVFP